MPGSVLRYFGRIVVERMCREDVLLMGRKPYADDPGMSEFTGDGQRTSEGHGAEPGVGVVPDEYGPLLEWYWTNPADPESAPEEGFRSIGDESVNRNRLGRPQ